LPYLLLLPVVVIIVIIPVIEGTDVEVVIRILHVGIRVAHTAVPPQIILVLVLGGVLLGPEEEHVLVEVRESRTVGGIVEVSGAHVHRRGLDVRARVRRE